MERQSESEAVGSTPHESAEPQPAPEPDGAPAQAVMVTLPPQPRFIRVARLVAAGLAHELGFGVDRLDDVRLAIGEACALAVQVGARDVRLSYVLEERGLRVAIDAELGSRGDQLDDDYIALVEQVLEVACSDHHIDRDDQRISIHVSFTDGI
jgi:serine/threonine-protein kinase RsbW